MYHFFLERANYLYEAEDAGMIFDGDGKTIIGYMCPECGEPIYYEDWAGCPETENWHVCPVCGYESED